MYQPHSPNFRGACRAIITAGPLFVTLTGAALLYMQIPAPIRVDPAALIIIPTILLFALIFGPFLACLPILVGTLVMRGISDHAPILAARPIWAAVGSAIGAGAAYGIGLFQNSGETTFALVVTCGASAWLCHGPHMAWH